MGTVKSGAELRASSNQKAAQASQPKSNSATSSSSSNSGAAKKTIRSGAELKTLTNARAAQISKSRQEQVAGVATYTPGNTRNVGMINYQMTHTEKQYNQLNNQLRQADYENRLQSYIYSGNPDAKTSGSFYKEALRNAELASDASLKDYWVKMADATKNQYLYDYSNESNIYRDQISKYSADLDTQKKNRQNAADAVTLGLYFDGDPNKAYKEANENIANLSAQLATAQSYLDQIRADAESTFMTPEVEQAVENLKQTGNPTRMWKYYNKLGAKDEHEALLMRQHDQEIVDEFNMMISGEKKVYTNADIWANTIAGWGGRAAAGYANAESLLARSIGTAQVVHSAEDEQKLLRGEEVKNAETPEWATSVGQHGERVNEWAMNANKESQELIASAKNSASKFGKFGIDLATTALDVGLDAATGPLSLVSMGARVMGQSALEAQEKGASLNEQIKYAAANTAVELLTEKLSDGLGLVYGKGFSSDMVEEAISKLAKTQPGANWLRFLANSTGEGVEEVISDLASPFLNWIIDEKARNEHLYDLDGSEVLYDFLLGSAIGMFGQGAERVSGAYTQKNKEIGIQPGTRKAADGGPVDNTAGKQGYINRYAGSETDVLNRQESPESDANEVLAEAIKKEEAKGSRVVDEAPGIEESTPEEKAANREAGKKAEWLVQEVQDGGKSLIEKLSTNDLQLKQRVAEAYKEATGKELNFSKKGWRKQLREFAKEQAGKKPVGEAENEAPSVSPVEAPESVSAEGSTDIAPAPAEEVKPTPTPATEAKTEKQRKSDISKAVGAITSGEVDIQAEEAHNESVAREDIQKAAETGVDSLMELYEKNPEAVSEYYKEVTGYDLSDDMVRDDLQELHRQALTLPQPEVKAEEAAPVEEKTEEPEAPAEPETKPEEWGTKEPVEEQKQETKPVEQKTEEQPKSEEKTGKPKRERKKREQAPKVARNVEEERANITQSLRDGTATVEDVEKAVGTSVLPKKAVTELVNEKYGSNAKSYKEALDILKNPPGEKLTEEQFREKALSMTWDDVKRARYRGEVTDDIIEAVTGINIEKDHNAPKSFGRWKEKPTTAEERTAEKERAEAEKNLPEAKTASEYLQQIVNNYFKHYPANEVVNLLDESSKVAEILFDNALNKFNEAEGETVDVRTAVANALHDYLGLDIDFAEYDKYSKAQQTSLKKFLAEELIKYRDANGITYSKNTTEKKGKGASKNVPSGLRESNRTRILGGSEEDVKGLFLGAKGDRQSVSGEVLFKSWKKAVNDEEAKGARRLTAEELEPDIASAINALLDNNVSFVTVLDASKMKTPPGAAGFVINEKGKAGIFLYVNANEKSDIPRGVVFLHEPVHYFANLFKDRNGDKPNFYDTLSIVSNALGFDVMNIIKAEEKFSGRNVIKKYTKLELTKEEFKTFVEKPLIEQQAYLRKYGATQENIDKCYQALFEEAVANTAAKNPIISTIIKDSGISDYNVDNVATSIREYLYENKIVPKGFFEKIAPYADALNNLSNADNRMMLSQDDQQSNKDSVVFGKITKKGDKANGQKTRSEGPEGILTYENAEKRFRENALRRGANEERAKTIYEAWKQDVDDLLLRTGGRIASWNDVPGEYRKIAEKMLSGVEGIENSGIPAITFIDMQDAHHPVGFYGYVMMDNPDAGFVAVLNLPNDLRAEPNKRRGNVFLHEPFHYFSAKYKQEHNGETIPYENYLLRIASKLIGDNSNIMDALEMRNSLINAEANHLGRLIFRKFGIELTAEERDSYRDKDLAEKMDYVDEKLQEFFGDQKDGEYFVWEIAADKYWKNVYDETLANLTSGNTAVADGSYDIDLAKRVSREFFYNEGFIPKGFYENYEQEVLDLNTAYAQYVESVEEEESIKALGQDYGSFDYRAKTMEKPRAAYEERVYNLIANSNRSAESLAYEFMKNEYAQMAYSRLTGFDIFGKDFDDMARLIQWGIETYRNNNYNRYALEEDNELSEEYEPETEQMPKVPSWLHTDFGEENPKFAPSKEHTMAARQYPGQKHELGRGKHEVQSDAEANKLGRAYLKEVLKSRESLAEAVNWLRYRTGAMTNAEQALAQMLFSEIGDAMTPIINGVRPRNKAFLGYTREELIGMERILKDSIRETKAPMAQGLRFKADISDTQTVRMNARESFFKNLKSDEIDRNAEDTKLEKIVEDYTYHIEKLDAEGTKDVQKMLKLAKDISYVRNVSSMFGLKSKAARNTENFILDYIAKTDPNAYDTLRSLALGSANRISSDFQTVGVAGTAAQIRYLNMLSNFATAVSNVGNNYLSIFNEANAQNVGKLLLGKYFENTTGEDQIGWDYSNSLSKDNLQALALGAARGFMNLYYGLEVDEGANSKIDYNIAAKFNQNTKVFGSSVIGKLLAQVTFLSGLKMQVTDAAAKARTLHGLNKGVDEMGLSDERRAFMYTDNANNADYRLFHNETPISQAVGRIRKHLDSKLRIGNDEVGYLGLGTLMMPFVKVPINVATHALRATPVGSFVGFCHVAKGMMKAKQMHSKVVANQIAAEEISDPAKWAKAERELDPITMRMLKKNRGTDALPNTFAKAVRLSGFEDAVEMSQQESANIIRTAGRVFTNTGLTLLGVLATYLGAIKNFDDEDDDDMKRLAREHGLEGIQLNLSAVLEGRKDQWDFDHDLIIGGNWLEIASIPFIAGAEIYKDAMEAGGEKKFENALKSAAYSPVTSLVNVADILKDMPGLEQLSNIYEAIENSTRYNSGNFKDKLIDSTIQYSANQAASFLIPNSVAQFSAGLDNTVRDVYNTDDPWKTAANIIANKTPFRGKLPERITSTGETRRYDNSRIMAIINKTILPGDFHRVTYSDLEKTWMEMSKNGAKNVMPPNSAPKKLTLNGEDYALDANERRQWQEITNTETATLQQMISGSPYWDDLSWDAKKEAFQAARKTSEHNATYMIKGEEADLVQDEYYDRWELNPNGMTGIAEFLPTKYYVKSMYDKDKNVTDYDALNSFIQSGEYDKLTEETKELLDNSFYYLDDMDDAWKKVKMTAEEYYAARAIYKATNEQEGFKGPDAIVNMHSDFAKLFGEGSQKAKYSEENFTIFNQTPGDTRTKDKIISNGYSLDIARQYINYNAQTDDMPGYDEIQNGQKYNNVLKMEFASEDERWKFFFDNVIPENYTGQRRKLARYMNDGHTTLAEALEKVRDSAGNPLSTVYAKDADGNKYVP